MNPLVPLCKLYQRVRVFNGRNPSLPGFIVGSGFYVQPHLRPGDPNFGEVIVSCVILLDVPFDTPHGLYVRHLILHPGEYETVNE
jgi:hypothetical protein